MRTQTTRSIKTISFVVFALTVFFLAFFENSKNIPRLAEVNPFADDPYDAVGSFAIQLSFFAALLCIIRSFRPYPTKEIPSSQQLLILRGEMVSLVSIIVTLVADIVAMLRYPSMWTKSPAGWILGGLVGVLLLLTILTSLLLYRILVTSSIPFASRWKAKLLIFLASILILAVYPDSLLESIPGGIFTALVGMLIFFLSTWAWVTTIFPQSEMAFEDIFDDAIPIYGTVRSRIGFISQLERFTNTPWLSKGFDFINPRKHKWKIILLVAVFMGGSLMLIEALKEGVSANPSMALLVFGVFLGIEGAGVLLGYFLFGEFLGILREE